jgi:hypothetical protein
MAFETNNIWEHEMNLDFVSWIIVFRRNAVSARRVLCSHILAHDIIFAVYKMSE